jgi:hypothetical protein
MTKSINQVMRLRFLGVSGLGLVFLTSFDMPSHWRGNLIWLVLVPTFMRGGRVNFVRAYHENRTLKKMDLIAFKFWPPLTIPYLYSFVSKYQEVIASNYDTSTSLDFLPVEPQATNRPSNQQ